MARYILLVLKEKGKKMTIRKRIGDCKRSCVVFSHDDENVVLRKLSELVSDENYLIGDVYYFIPKHGVK